MTDRNSSSRLVPAAEFAASLGRPPRWVSDGRYRGADLPVAITVGGRVFFVQEDIDAWIREKRDRARSEQADRRRAVDRAASRSPNRVGESRGPRAAKQSGSFEIHAIGRSDLHGEE